MCCDILPLTQSNLHPPASFVKSSLSSMNMNEAYSRKWASSSFDNTSCNGLFSLVSTLQPGIKHLFLLNLIVLLRVLFISMGASVSLCFSFLYKVLKFAISNFTLARLMPLCLFFLEQYWHIASRNQAW